MNGSFQNLSLDWFGQPSTQAQMLTSRLTRHGHGQGTAVAGVYDAAAVIADHRLPTSLRFSTSKYSATQKVNDESCDVASVQRSLNFQSLCAHE